MIYYLWQVNKSEFIYKCNLWASDDKPFLFIVDYEMENFQIFQLDNLAGENILYRINGQSNIIQSETLARRTIEFDVFPISFKKYETAFSLVRKNIIRGNSFLLNLTFPSSIRTNLELKEIFSKSKAPNMLYYKDQFIVFSPETFIRISNDSIFSYPMKGTIDASIPDAERLILENEKEIWEHNTIVDLIRNDLSMVAKEVMLTHFRYVDRIQTNKKTLLQVSSEISGKLTNNWKQSLGNMIVSLLPAGSICGAPKGKTLEIIAEAEGQKRGFFTGIFGIFDGTNLDSAVMIRYIERTGNGLQFRSGGGITAQSKPLDEYREMIEKVYVPII